MRWPSPSYMATLEPSWTALHWQPPPFMDQWICCLWEFFCFGAIFQGVCLISTSTLWCVNDTILWCVNDTILWCVNDTIWQLTVKSSSRLVLTPQPLPTFMYATTVAHQTAKWHIKTFSETTHQYYPDGFLKFFNNNNNKSNKTTTDFQQHQSYSYSK